MAKSEDAFTIEVLNWKKHNERKDAKRGAPWFKVDTNLFADAFIQKLTSAQFKVWFYLLSECSKCSGNVLKLSRKCTVRALNLRWKRIEAALELFETDLRVSWKRTPTVPPAYSDCTTSVPPAYSDCTTSVPPAYSDCTTSVPPAYSDCTTSVPPAYHQRTLKNISPNDDSDLSDSHVTDTNTCTLLQSRVEKSREEKRRVEYVNPEADACGGPTATDPKTSRPAKEKPSEFDFEIADAWHEHALTVAPKKKCNRDREADAVRILRSVDGYSEADIRAVLDFVKRDSFWRTVALSPCGLRITKPGGTRKIDSIVAGMKRGPSGSSSSSKSYQDEQKRTVFDVLDEVGA